ncbi:hypothetical protein LCGC14_0847740 [marine sediment metagenome]|uniref:Uncharacterized protein n=1 Tax=marine sediment metagenome TaxID=412755 RepID=A0A0F9PG02_9ZZZZ
MISMTENDNYTYDQKPWHWTETDLSIDSILRKSAGIRRIRNKLKEKKRKYKPEFIRFVP